jgi:3-methyladenine DNA glycosylase Tag
MIDLEPDDRKLFEFLILEGMQAVLSWSIVLNKRENFRKAFQDFDARRSLVTGSAISNACS